LTFNPEREGMLMTDRRDFIRAAALVGGALAVPVASADAA